MQIAHYIFQAEQLSAFCNLFRNLIRYLLCNLLRYLPAELFVYLSAELFLYFPAKLLLQNRSHLPLPVCFPVLNRFTHLYSLLFRLNPQIGVDAGV